MAPRANRYAAIIEDIFQGRYRGDEQAVDFDREDIVASARTLRLELPRNLGDLIYSFRYRVALPDSILGTAPHGKAWIIRPAGRGKYRFELVRDIPLTPSASLAAIKVPDATPGMIARYAFNDEQAVLARPCGRVGSSLRELLGLGLAFARAFGQEPAPFYGAGSWQGFVTTA